MAQQLPRLVVVLLGGGNACLFRALFSRHKYLTVPLHATDHVAGIKLNHQLTSVLGSNVVFITNIYPGILINAGVLKCHTVALLFNALCIITSAGGISYGFAFAYDMFRLFTAGTNLVRK